MCGPGAAQTGTVSPAALAVSRRPNADPYPEYPVNKQPDRSTWGKRQDGTSKGDGWLGVRSRPDGGVSTEVSVGMEIEGKEREVPLMVPGLDREEMRYLMTRDPEDEKFLKEMPKSILRKAQEHASKRLAKGKSPFRDAGEMASD